MSRMTVPWTHADQWLASFGGPVMAWWETLDNLTRLGSALVKAGFTVDELQRYYEKPWTWTQEWDALQHSQRVLELVLSGETLAEALVEPDVVDRRHP